LPNNLAKNVSKRCNYELALTSVYNACMVQYRRNRVHGGTYFFTVTLKNRQSQLFTNHLDLLRDAFRSVRHKQPFQIIAIVILPEHLHTVWTLPTGDENYSARWQAIKSQFTRSVIKQGVELTKNRKGEYDVWQRRFWEHTIADDLDLTRHVDYIHYNPVKHGLVKHAKDWPASSFHRYVRLGLLNESWGSAPVDELEISFGE